MEVTALLKVLSTCDTYRDVPVIRCRLFDLLMLSRNGFDIHTALPTVVKLLAMPDAFVKRIAGEIMVIHCSNNQDVALLAINTLAQDCGDLNPVIRGLSFKIIGNLTLSVMSDVFSSLVSKGLGDGNVYARRAAALASIGLNKVSSSTVLEGDIWDLLYYHLRDNDSLTVASCLCALEEVCAKEKGVVVSNKMGQYLIKNMTSYTPPVQRLVLQFLIKFSPKTKSLMFESLNELDENLSKSKSVVKTMCTLNLFCYLTTDLPHITQKVYKVAWSTLMRILGGERSEELLSASIHFINSTGFPAENLCQDVTKFLYQENDHPHLINEKIKFLSQVINANNMDKIFGDFLSCARTLGHSSIKILMHSVVDIANCKAEMRKSTAHFLRQLLDTRKSDVIGEVLQILPSIPMTDEDIWTDVISSVQTNHHLAQSMPAKIALLQIIQSYPSRFEDAVDIFDHLFKFLEAEKQNTTDSNQKKDQMASEEEKLYNWFKVTFLGAAVQVFFCGPAKTHPFLVRIMELCIQDSNKWVRERGRFYYGFLIGKTNQLTESES